MYVMLTGELYPFGDPDADDVMKQVHLFYLDLFSDIFADLQRHVWLPSATRSRRVGLGDRSAQANAHTESNQSTICGSRTSSFLAVWRWCKWRRSGRRSWASLRWRIWARVRRRNWALIILKFNVDIHIKSFSCDIRLTSWIYRDRLHPTA